MNMSENRPQAAREPLIKIIRRCCSRCGASALDVYPAAPVHCPACGCAAWDEDMWYVSPALLRLFGAKVPS